ncbi:MAG: cupin domain-containing protein [Propionibacteriaceae bacterium]|nr:cupin domain-containing protein [Propionibacteriaceae bacterium]
MTAITPTLALVEELLEEARAARAHRASRTVSGGRERAMRQTLIALTAGAELGEHESPGEATLLVLAGEVVLRAGGDAWPLRTGDHIEIPRVRHSVHATADAAFLLTAVPEERGGA